jgi:hypothetical protein
MHDLVRGFGWQNFLMETQPDRVNWSSVNNVLTKGKGDGLAGYRAWCRWYLVWQWRSALGQEQYHGT